MNSDLTTASRPTSRPAHGAAGRRLGDLVEGHLDGLADPEEHDSSADVKRFASRFANWPHEWLLDTRQHLADSPSRVRAEATP